MDKYLVDFINLEQTIDRPKVYKLADVKDKITKVAFDVVRFTSGEDTAQLWRIEESVDGPVIVAMYDVPGTDEKVAEASVREWDIVVDNSNNMNIVYKGEAIKRFAAADMGFEDSDIPMMCRWLPEKLASDKNLRSALLKDISDESRDLLLSKYPELRG